MLERCLALAAIALMLCTGCAVTPKGAYQPLVEGSRDSLKAQELTHKAATLMDDDLEAAERLLREALTADLYHGPAHNNLGVVFLKQSKLYEAANEFEWARKLMPGHPDPRLNLGLTLECAGRYDEALASYDAALEVFPGHLPSIQALARLQLRHNLADSRTAALLDDIALQSDSQQWRDWAKEQRTRRLP